MSEFESSPGRWRRRDERLFNLAPSYSAFDANWRSSSNLATVVEDPAFDEGMDDFPMVFIEEALNV